MRADIPVAGNPPFFFMEIKPTTSLNDAIARIAKGDIGAGSVLALILKDRPDATMRFMREMDSLGIYGQDLWWLYKQCGIELATLLKSFSNGRAKTLIGELRKSRGEK